VVDFTRRPDLSPGGLFRGFGGRLRNQFGKRREHVHRHRKHDGGVLFGADLDQSLQIAQLNSDRFLLDAVCGRANMTFQSGPPLSLGERDLLWWPAEPNVQQLRRDPTRKWMHLF